MLAILVCRCSGAELKAREFLKERGIGDWLSIPTYKGKIACQEFLKTLPELPDGPDPVGALQSYLTGAGAFVIFVGYDSNHFMWSNIHRGGLQEVADAEVLLERFA